MTRRVCTIVLKNEVAAFVRGLSPEHLQILTNENSEYVPGYKHMPLFQLGTWDGKVKFFSKTGKTFIVFLPELIKRIRQWGYQLQLEDRRDPFVIDVDPVQADQFVAHGWMHREHQLRSINAVIENNHKGIILACTGAGKTAIAAGISYAYEQAANFRSIVIVPSNDLVIQTLGTYDKFGLNATSLQGGSRDDEKYKHVITTWQTLKNYPDRLKRFQVLMCDELQGAKSPVVSSLLIEHGNHIPVRVGLTGTLPKEPADYKTIYAGVGATEVAVVTAKELQALGYLATLNITQIQLQDTARQPIGRFQEYSQEITHIGTMGDRDKWLAEFIQTVSETGNTLILVPGVKTGRRLERILGDRCVFVYGKDSTKVRQQVYASFADNNNIIVIANVQIAAVGLSIDRIYNLTLIDIGKAFTRVIQSIGRGLRMAADKTHLEVYDIGSDYSFSAHHADKRVEYYDEAEYPCKRKYVNYRR